MNPTTPTTTTTFHDIYEYMYTPFWKTTPFMATLVGLATIFTGIAIYFWIKHVKAKRAQARAVTPWEWAFSQLESLNPSTYETKAEFKQFYFEVTRIVKLYLQKRFSWDVVEKTDDELVPYLYAKLLDSNLITTIKQVLEESLLIKFANAQALREQAHKDLEAIKRVVEQTTPENR